MPVRNALLALVAQQPAGVYRLKQMFEDQTCGAWPLNIGQVYQTMQRLERDGSVVSHQETNAGRDSEVFEITEAGLAILDEWWASPVARENPERDELVMKLAVAAADPTVDVTALIQTQRRSTLSALRDVTRLKAGASDIADRFPDGLSGGEQQRIAIARALVGRRSIIMADEPTGALDSNSGEKVMLALRNRIDSGVAGILVTHEARFAAWADRTVFLRDGRIIDSSRSDRVEDLL